MDYALLFSILIPGFLISLAIFFFVELKNIESKMKDVEKKILSDYFSRIDKIPALVETIRLYAEGDEIYKDILLLHRNAIIGSTKSIYDMLEINARISSTFSFLMRLSIRIRPLATNASFLYVRDFWIFSEKAMQKELENYDRLMTNYDKIRSYKNQTIFGLFFPVKDYVRIRA